MGELWVLGWASQLCDGVVPVATESWTRCPAVVEGMGCLPPGWGPWHMPPRVPCPSVLFLCSSYLYATPRFQLSTSGVCFLGMSSP